MNMETIHQEREWHLQQLLEATLTNKRREYHRDCLAWLDEAREQKEQQPVRARASLQRLWQMLARWAVPDRVWKVYR
ncbi:MAG TPA: hypothetical protein VF099_02630 [Ktedonobacterales bacterium]